MAKTRFAETEQTTSPDAKRDLAWRQNGRDAVSAQVEQMILRRGSDGLADCVPRTVKAAAAWVLDVLIEGPQKDESIRRDSKGGWTTPYSDRALFLAAKFLGLPAGQQEAIAAHAREGLRWRGDNTEFLDRVAVERLMTDNVERAKRALTAMPRMNAGG